MSLSGARWVVAEVGACGVTDDFLAVRQRRGVWRGDV